MAARALLGITVMAAPGCGWQSYAVTRSVRHFTGSTTRMHVIAPLTVSLQRYRAIELAPVVNLLPAHVTANVPRELGVRLERRLRALPSRPRIEEIGDQMLPGADAVSSEPALALEVALDDFEAGSRPLRALEVGFNHVAVTVRVRVSREDTGEVLGAVSITAQDDRESGSTSTAMDHVVSAIGHWIGDGYAR